MALCRVAPVCPFHFSSGKPPPASPSHELPGRRSFEMNCCTDDPFDVMDRRCTRAGHQPFASRGRTAGRRDCLPIGRWTCWGGELPPPLHDGTFHPPPPSPPLRGGASGPDVGDLSPFSHPVVAAAVAADTADGGGTAAPARRYSWAPPEGTSRLRGRRKTQLRSLQNSSGGSKAPCSTRHQRHRGFPEDDRHHVLGRAQGGPLRLGRPRR